MAFRLRNWLEEAVATVNPFDGGKTAATVRASRPASPPAQTRPAPQAPSYGTGLGGVFNRVRDTFDANTPQDQWKRQQQQQAWRAPLQMPKPVDTRNLWERTFDQANIFDNNRTFKQADPTQTKSAFQQGGQFGGQVVRGTIGGTARVANTIGAQGAQVIPTAQMLMAQATGNTEAWRNANAVAQAADENFKRNEGGLLNTGTLYNTEEARRGDLKTGATRIGGGIAESGLEVASLGLGGFTGKQVAKQGLRQGIKSQVPIIAKNALLNTAQGGVMAANQGAQAGDIAKSAALSGALGTVGDVGLGVAGAGIAKAASNIPPSRLVSNVQKLATDEGGFIQPGRTPKRVHPEDQNVMADFIDYQRGVYKPDPDTAYNLELDASRIAERYGMPMPNSTQKLANVFDKRLQQEGFGQPDMDVTQRLMLDYAKNPAVKPPSNSLTGDGALAPTAISAARRQELMQNMRQPKLTTRLVKNTKALMKDEGGFVRGSEPDPLEALKAEARKYKSAEEFVNSQIRRPQATDNVWQDTLPSGSRPKSVGEIVKSGGNPLYHDTSANGVLGILDSGEIKASQAPFSQMAGQGKRVSTTRNFDNYSRYNKSPYRLVIDESKTGQRAIPDNREEFESIFKKGVPTKAVKSVSIDVTNPALLDDIRSGKLAEVIKKSKEKGIIVEPFEGKVLPNEGANAEVQTMTSRAFSDAFPEYNTKLKQLTDLYNQATQSQPSKTAFDTNLEQAGIKPQGFILKETKGRGGRKDTVRVTNGKKGLVATQQSEPTIQAKQYSEAFDVPIEQAQKDMAQLETQDPMAGTRKTMERVKNSGKENIVDDMIDQKQYGVKDIQAEPTNTIDDFINKQLDVEQLSDADMKVNRRGEGALGDIREVRDQIRGYNPLRAGNDAVGRGFEKLSRMGAAGRKLNRVAQYINKNAGQDPAMVKAAQKYAGENTYADASLLQIGKQAYDLLPDESARARVHAVLDPESAGNSLKFDDLKPNEQQALNTLRDLGDAINDTSYRMGMISEKKWKSNRGGRYIARLYNEVASTADIADLLELPDKRGLHLGMYKSRTELNDAMREQLIRDPVKLAVIRARQVRQNEALLGYMQTAEARGYVSAKPKDGFVKVTPQNRMANWSGKYVRQDVYENIEGFRAMGKGMNAINNLLDVYDGLPPRRLRKKMLTIFNPVVRTGNVTSNYFFAYLNGVNPARFQANKSWAKKALKSNDPLKIAAQRSGLIGNDIISSDRNLFDARKSFMDELDASSSKKIGKKLKSMNERISQRYGEADDIAKLSAMKAHIDRGFSVEEAIEKTRRGFQDYSRVGHAYDMAAKAPVFGNAFVRFQGDLWMNIIKNAAVDHPARLASMVVGIAALGEGLSNLSGETDEDKKTREDRAGAPKIPFTNVSTEFQTPWGAVDVARFTPLYMRQDIDGNSFADQISRLSPVNIPSNLSKSEIVKKAASDPLIGPVISTVGDTDWRGKSVADPDGVRDGKELYPDNPLSNAERNRNRLQYGVRSFAPYPFNEVGDVLASKNQDKRNEQAKDGGKYDPRQEGVDILGRTGYNTSGSKKSLGQSLWRTVGIRAQEFNSEDAKKKREDDKMFAFFDQTDKFKAGLDSTTKQQFEARHKGTQTRDGIKAEFESDPWYKYKNASELLQNPKLFEAEKEYAKLQNKYDGRPIDPLFNLPKDQRNIVLAKKLKLPGSKDEGFNSLYDQEWYQNFRVKQDKYYNAKSKYAKSKGWSDYESDNPYPEAKKEVQKAMDYYFTLPSGTGARSGFIRSNPHVWAAITGQWDKQNAWTDREREKLGLPAIARDNDKKFSYSSGSGSSRSRSGSRGGRGGTRSAKGKFDYKLDAFAPKGGNLSKQLAKLVEEAGGKSKVKIKKAKNIG